MSRIFLDFHVSVGINLVVNVVVSYLKCLIINPLHRSSYKKF